MTARHTSAIKQNRAVKPEKLLALGFLALIIIGGALLALPVSAVSRSSIGIFEGLFTATSAVCVTGLSVVDVGTQLSGFGQAVLLCLIQIGGLGFMAFATLGMVALGRRISLRGRMLLRDSMNQTTLKGMVRLSLWFALMAITIELTGACVLMTRLVPLYGVKGVWYSFFTAISAFCNAGFDLFGGYRSVMDFSGDKTVLITLGMLITLGGLGFSVILECIQECFRFRRLSLHAKLVLTSSAILIVLGTVIALLLEWSNKGTLGAMSVSDKLLNGAFQSVTLRTAGFSALDQLKLTDASKLLGAIFMFIGASPASTGGGVKTTTISILIVLSMCVIRGRDRICVFDREISLGIVRRAITIILIGFVVVLVCTCAISVIEASSGYNMLDILFEASSAFSTTGLSSIGTGALSRASQVLLMPLMYFGRVGPLTLAFALASRMDDAKAANRVHHPEESIMIG